MLAISSYGGYRPTNKHTHRQDRLQYTAPQLASAQCNDNLHSERDSNTLRMALTAALDNTIYYSPAPNRRGH